ncbi:hypothetical protein ABZP36_014756 [Zizania latifolia]
MANHPSAAAAAADASGPTPTAQQKKRAPCRLRLRLRRRRRCRRRRWRRSLCRRLEEGGEPLPCPRCGSRETKFCYFNNYNVRQPRHLCRSCRRYWTAGGALRRVASASPGRRRPRTSSSRSAAPAAAAATPTSEGAESVDSRS